MLRVSPIFAVVFLAASCSPAPEPEAMIQIHRAEDRDRFLKILEAEAIPYDLNEHGQIHYPVSYTDEIDAAQEALWGPVDESVKGVTVNTEIAPALASALTAEGIDYEVSNLGETTMFRWNIFVNEQAMNITSKVLGDAGT